MKNRYEERPPDPSPLKLSLLVSEWVYLLVVIVERLIRWTTRYLIRPCILQFRCLLW